MIKFLSSYIIKISILSLVLLLLHFFLFQNTYLSIQNLLIQKFYVFLILLNLITFFVLIQVKLRKDEFVGYTFLSFVLVKMIVSFVFLYPTIKSNNSNKEHFVLLFFFLYFVFLIFETIMSVSLINSKK